MAYASALHPIHPIRTPPYPWAAPRAAARPRSTPPRPLHSRGVDELTEYERSQAQRALRGQRRRRWFIPIVAASLASAGALMVYVLVQNAALSSAGLSDEVSEGSDQKLGTAPGRVETPPETTLPLRIYEQPGLPIGVKIESQAVRSIELPSDAGPQSSLDMRPESQKATPKDVGSTPGSSTESPGSSTELSNQATEPADQAMHPGEERAGGSEDPLLKAVEREGG